MRKQTILGIDPGLAKTGWGLIQTEGSNLQYIACGTIKTKASLPNPQRLKQLYEGLKDIVNQYHPMAAAVEEVYVNNNARSSLSLGQARGIALLVPTQAGLEVMEYTPSEVKQSLVGTGRADKTQIGFMVKTLLPTAKPETEDAADALAIAITHAHMASFKRLAG
ncbi:MAG: crossover junction endodeoxyribonuclease RuvC [Alphaproteobacteria bacterium]|nr:crossover junction endodeoxyribonuclease RuvC [Alphaproteobacteria bacterium]MDD9920525.1 crossover junction endodeoxyribonuclease RuvC [Alphaproteobacteria bacterium]